MVNFEFRDHYTVKDLEEIVAILRHPGGCPWDREQTHESLRRCFAEETCEVLEAIDQKNDTLLQEELGDVLLQVVFHASLAKDEGKFDLDDVADGICKKMIFRHPHVFGSDRASTTEEVLQNWEEIKRVEKGQKTDTDTLEAVARTLPALWRAEKLQKKALKSHIVQTGKEDLLNDLRAAEQALGEAQDETALRSALGEVLFAAAGMAYAAGLDPEEVLQEKSDAYIAHFARAEERLKASGRTAPELTQEEAKELWNATEKG